MREPIKVSGEACNLGLYTCEVLMKCLTLIKFTLSTKKTHNIPKWDISAECWELARQRIFLSKIVEKQMKVDKINEAHKFLYC